MLSFVATMNKTSSNAAATVFITDEIRSTSSPVSNCDPLIIRVFAYSDINPKALILWVVPTLKTRVDVIQL
jgi:hypothetical protein